MSVPAPIGGAGPGSGVRELVEVMDLLRSPGGCPWDAQQTHESLVPYALEEAYEVVEAIETGDRAGLREELGDLLLQVVFHARVAHEDPEDPFDLDDVARGVAAKLVRRHPHVFAAPVEGDAVAGGAVGGGAEDAHTRWDRIKKDEKHRTSVLEGIPLAQGALARGQKVIARAARAGLDLDVAAVAGRHGPELPPQAGPGSGIGARLLLIVAEADAAGVDAEAALRSALRSLDAAVRAAEVAPAVPSTARGSGR